VITNVGKMRVIKWFIYFGFIIILANNCTPKIYVGQSVHFWGDSNYYDVLILGKDATFQYIIGEYQDVQIGPLYASHASATTRERRRGLLCRSKFSAFLSKNSLHFCLGEQKCSLSFFLMKININH
jgi:hypothetical protein